MTIGTKITKYLKARLEQFSVFVSVAGLKPGHITAAALFSFVAAVFDGLSMAMLPILLRGLGDGNFEFVRNVPIIRWILVRFPAEIEHRNGSIFFILLAVTFGFALLKNAFQYTSLIALSVQLRSCANQLRKRLFEKFVDLNKAFFDRTNPGRMYQTAIGDTELLSYAMQTLNGSILAVFSFVVYFFLLLRLSPELTLFVILVMPPMQWITHWVLKKIYASSIEYDTMIKRLGERLHGAMSCITLVKLYGQEKIESEKYERLSDEVMRHQISIDRKRDFLAPANEVLMLSMMMLLIAVSAFLVVKKGRGQITDFMVYFVILKKILNNVSVLSSFQSQLAWIHGPALSMLSCLKTPGETELLKGGRVCGPLQREILINNLSFRYDNHRPVFDGLTIKIPRQQVTAIVGRTGSGKSTLVQLLLRFYEPSKESIFMDGIDVTEFEIRSYRSRFAVVAQDTVVFNDSVRNNLTYGLDRSIADQELMSVLERARLTDLIKTHKDGLDLIVGEKGYQLSGGERQRLAIARALLRDADIIILDEATSAMDSETEKKVQESVDELVKQKTAIVIAHRLSTIRKADRVVVLDRGSVVEEGAPENLLRDGGIFHKLWELQGISPGI